MPPADLLRGHAKAWVAATTSPFLQGVRDGTLPQAQFAAWLSQDALFVADLLRLQAALLARAPRGHVTLLAHGCAALADELDWFQTLGAAPAPPRPVTAAYTALLSELAAGPYDAAVTALWLLEAVYLQAWTGASPGAPCYAAAVAHWTDPGFAAYVAALERLATPGHDEVLGRVLALEAGFWR